MLGSVVSFSSLFLSFFLSNFFNLDFFDLFFSFSRKKNSRGLLGKVEREKIDDNQNTKRITQIHAANILIDRQIAVLRKHLNLSLRAVTRRRQCEKDVSPSGKIVTSSESLVTSDPFTEIITQSGLVLSDSSCTDLINFGLLGDISDGGIFFLLYMIL